MPRSFSARWQPLRLSVLRRLGFGLRLGLGLGLGSTLTLTLI